MLTVIGKQLELRQIKVFLDLDPELPPILADKNRLEQIFINLAMNARDALEESSHRKENTSNIQTRFKEGRVTDPFLRQRLRHPSGDSETRFSNRFFPPRGWAQGTGLGLSISYGIVRDYHGEIRVDSRPDRERRSPSFFPPYREGEE